MPDRIPPETDAVLPSTRTSFLVTQVWDLKSRDGLMVSGRTLTGKLRTGMTLEDGTGRQAPVLSVEFPSPRDIATGEVTIMVERTTPSPVRPQVLLTEALVPNNPPEVSNGAAVESAEMAICLVTRVRDHSYRDGLLVSAKILDGAMEVGMTLHDEAGHRARVIQLEFLSPRDVATVEVTFLVERTDPNPARENAILWTIDDSGRRPPQAEFFLKYYAEHPYSNQFHPRRQWPRDLPPGVTTDVVRQMFARPGSGLSTPSAPARPETTFLVTEAEDDEHRDGLLVTGRTLTGKIEVGMTLHDVAGHRARVIQLEGSVPKRGEVSFLVERTTPSPAQPQAVLTAMAASD